MAAKPDIIAYGAFCYELCTYLINGEKLENPKAFAILMGIITVATILFNIIRAKASYTLRKKSAESWWEAEGKEAVILLRQALDRIIDKGNSYLSENPLLYEIPESYRTEDDCYALYKIILQRRAFSIEEALSVYADDITAQHQRWLEKYEADKRWEEFSERQEEMQRTLEQTRQELAFADYLIDDIRIHQKYGD